MTPEQKTAKIAAQKRWRESNPEKVRELARKYYWANIEANREKINARNRERYRAGKRKAKPVDKTKRNDAQRLWREKNPLYKVKGYGITPEDYLAMLAKQHGVCAICKGPPTGSAKRYHVDHDHRNGRVRGLLCMRCNFAIGYLKDDPQHARSAAVYLEQHQ